jgi:hypothetical protein
MTAIKQRHQQTRMRVATYMIPYYRSGLLVKFRCTDCDWTCYIQNPCSATVPRDGEEKAKEQGERLEWLSQHLNLTEDQKKQLKPVLTDEFKQMRAVGEDASLTQDQKRERMKQIHEASRPQVQGIITPEQQQKFAQIEGRSQRATRREYRTKDRAIHSHHSSEFDSIFNPPCVL